MQPVHRHRQPQQQQQQQTAPLSNAQHRGGDWRNEIPLGNAAVPLDGGPFHGEVVYQPPEVSEVELSGPDGKLHVYRDAWPDDERRFVYAGVATSPPSAADLTAENARLRAELEALKAKA